MRVVLVSHSSLAQAMLEAAEMFLGKQENVGVVCLWPGDFPEDFEDECRKAAVCEKDEECLIMCDILSGTPFNTASRISYRNDRIKVLYGMNLAMVVEVLSNRDYMNLEELCADIASKAPETYGIGKY